MKTKPQAAAIAPADGDTDHVGPWHELAKAQNVGELFLVDPSALFDHDTTCPHNAAAEAAKRHFEKRKEQRIK